MASSIQPDVRFVYFIPLPAFSHVVALASSAIFLSSSVYIPLRIGLERTLDSPERIPLLALLFAILGAGIAFLFLAFWTPRSWVARLEFEASCIRSIPRPIYRWIGEPATEMPIAAHAQEILLCRGSQDKLQIGFRVIVPATDGTERDLKVETGGRLNARQAGILTDGIASVTRLPVRLIKRERLNDGGFAEAPWTPSGSSDAFAGLAKLLFATTPLLGGIVMGILHPGLVAAIAVGIGLWLCQTLALFAFAKFSHQKSTMFSKLYWLTTVFTFTASYAVIYFLVSTISQTQTH